MNHNPPSADPLARRANDLYWDSDRSVNQIAEDMDISKGMLYGLVDPLPSELPCPRCSTTLEYANRTARDRGLLRCPECGLEDEEADMRAEWEEDAAVAPGGALVMTPGATPTHRTRAAGAGGGLSKPDPVLVGTGLLLVAAGLWLFRSLGRRS